MHRNNALFCPSLYSFKSQSYSILSNLCQLSKLLQHMEIVIIYVLKGQLSRPKHPPLTQYKLHLYNNNLPRPTLTLPGTSSTSKTFLGR